MLETSSRQHSDYFKCFNRSPQSSCNVCLLVGLIRHDIFICTQMHHKVIMDYFPKTEQNSERDIPQTACWLLR